MVLSASILESPNGLGILILKGEQGYGRKFRSIDTTPPNHNFPIGKGIRGIGLFPLHAAPSKRGAGIRSGSYLVH